MTCPFDLTNEKVIIPFNEQDPYNPQNTLKGFINKRQGQLYGSLWITHVNDKKCEQFVQSTPKIDYPFDRNNKWKTYNYDKIELYDKLDGTCIISYTYKDAKGNLFLTYKTRLRPFLGQNKFGNFYSLWNEMLEKYPDIEELCFDRYINYAFELYGKRNKILIQYDTPLDTKLIFAIFDGNIYAPNGLTYDLNVPKNKGYEYITESDIQVWYKKWQDFLEYNLQVDEENEIIKGTEGIVIYFIKDGKAKQIKCKPPTILKYHWGHGGIPTSSIYTTVFNAFENYDVPTYDDVVELLQEEYDMDRIEKSKVRIQNTLAQVLFDKNLQYSVIDDYKKQGFDINKDKATCMRWFGKHYSKHLSKKIYNLLIDYFGKEE